MERRTRSSLSVLALCVFVFAQSPASAGDEKAVDTAPIKRIAIYVSPYYDAGATDRDRPQVAVHPQFDTRLASGKREDIVAVRDAIRAEPQLVTPMTLMVLAICLYDAGLRDEAVFWFYAAKNRYLTMIGVLDMESPMFAQVNDSVRNFDVLAGPFFNSYAFCDLRKQRDARIRAVEWVERHPYQALFMERFPARAGDRAENLKKALSDIRERGRKEQEYLDDPGNLTAFLAKRRERRVAEQFCWND